MVKELIFHRLQVPAVERHASATAYIDTGPGKQVTFETHLERVARLASGLRGELGLGRGDRMAVLAMNGLRYIELWHAALLGGGVINPLNLRFCDDGLGFVLADSGTTVCFVDAAHAATIDRVR